LIFLFFLLLFFLSTVISKSKNWDKALLSQTDFRGSTALHHAVATNVKDVVKLLLELGAGQLLLCYSYSYSFSFVLS